MRTQQQVAAIESLRSGAELARLGAYLMRSGEMGYPGALQIAIADGASGQVQAILRAAVSEGNTTNSSALASLRPISDGFLQLVKGYSFFDAMAADAISIPVATRAVVASGTGNAALVGESAPAPLMKFSVSAPALEPVKVQGIVALSDELIRLGGAPLERLLSSELRRAIAASTDQYFISQITPTGSPTPDIASQGNDAAGVLDDIGLLLAALATDPYSRVHLGMSHELCKILATMPTTGGQKAFPNMRLNGGELGGFPVTASLEIADDEVIAVDASRFAVSVGEVTIDRSSEATLEFEDEPDNPVTAGTIKRSLWQMNMSALKAERRFAFEQLTINAVAKLVNAQWGQEA